MENKNDNIKNFIEKLIEKTSKNEILWKYLDTNETLCKVTNLKPLLFVFDVNNSFYTSVETGFIIIYKSLPTSNEKKPLSLQLNLYLVPSSYRDYKYIPNDTYGEDIVRLHTIIRSKFPSTDDIMKEILGF